MLATVAGVVTVETEPFDNAAKESKEAKPVVVVADGAGEAGADECMKWLNAAIELPGIKGTADA